MNQNLSKLGAQLRDIWMHLGAAQRLSVAAATFVLLGGLGTLAFWSSRADYGLLYGRLSDGEAAKVIAALDDAKVSYKVGAGGSSILVPGDKVHLMRMQLAGRGIPRGDGVGFEIFDKPNFGISDFVQRANYVRAVQGELGRTISQLDEIESARVMIVLPENRLLLDKDKYATASVFVRVRGNSQLQPQSINSIRFLVANSVEGLKPNHVTVIDNLGNVLSENSDNDLLSGLTSTQLAARRNLEQYLARKAQDMLEKVLGAGQAIVRISAEINYDTVTRSEEKFDPDGQVLRSQTKTDENTDASTATASVAAGISANANTDTNNATTTASPLNTTKNKKAVTTVQYEIGKLTSNTMQAAGGIKRLSAAVTVAAQFEGAGADRKVVNRSPEELEKLRRIVASAVGIQTGTDNPRADTITLEELPFNDQLATTVARDFETQQKHDLWWGIARNAGYPALAIVILFVLLRLFKRTPVQEIQLGVPVGRLMAAQKGAGNGNGFIGQPWGAETSPGVVSVDVLNRLIKENPSNMTQAVREWMDKGRSAKS
jgi:flagellar M-ring protein FliF